MAVNVKGLWLCAKAVVPAMQRRKQGSIVNISSNMAFNGGQGMMHYVVSKAAVVGFSRVLAREIGGDNIRVNTLAPGSTMSEERPTEDAVKNYERTASTRILKRIEQPEDLVGTALYLLSDLSSFVTGQVILVNGGAVLH
jgi:3-oxoacyl-[acyl-carrier protein] reductase